MVLHVRRRDLSCNEKACTLTYRSFFVAKFEKEEGKSLDLYEQMDIFELLDTCFRTSMQTALPVMEDKAEDMQEEMSFYLRREEKILSIARERMKRMESGCCITEDGQGCSIDSQLLRERSNLCQVFIPCWTGFLQLTGWMAYAGTVGTFYNPDTRESFQKIV